MHIYIHFLTETCTFSSVKVFFPFFFKVLLVNDLIFIDLSDPSPIILQYLFHPSMIPLHSFFNICPIPLQSFFNICAISLWFLSNLYSVPIISLFLNNRYTILFWSFTNSSPISLLSLRNGLLQYLSNISLLPFFSHPSTIPLTSFFHPSLQTMSNTLQLIIFSLFRETSVWEGKCLSTINQLRKV